MKCSDSSSRITIQLDDKERLVTFDFAKITCERGIEAETGYSTYCAQRTLEDILTIPFEQAAGDLKLLNEEEKFILYLEWDALRSAIVQYVGVEDEKVDKNRCRISSIDYSPEGVSITQVILPPKNMPEISPC